MIFVKALYIRRQMLHKELLQFVVRGIGRGKTQPCTNPPRIGIYNKNRLLRGIEQNRVRRLGANPIDCEQLSTLGRQIAADQLDRIAVIVVV